MQPVAKDLVSRTRASHHTRPIPADVVNLRGSAAPGTFAQVRRAGENWSARMEGVMCNVAGVMSPVAA